MPENVTEIGEWASKRGTVRVGQVYRDRRDSNTRWLRVDRLTLTRWNYGPDTVEAWCVVVRHDHGEGRVDQPMRETRMIADRLLSRSFILVDGVPE